MKNLVIFLTLMFHSKIELQLHIFIVNNSQSGLLFSFRYTHGLLSYTWIGQQLNLPINLNAFFEYYIIIYFGLFISDYKRKKYYFISPYYKRPTIVFVL